MKPETSAFLQKAHNFLVKADALLNVLDYPDEAGRAAYLAGLHGAQALIFEHTHKVIRRHRGVHNELRRLTKDEATFDRDLGAFLGRAYNLKAVADYDTDPSSRVTVEQAERTIATARRFIDCIEKLLEDRRD